MRTFRLFLALLTPMLLLGPPMADATAAGAYAGVGPSRYQVDGVHVHCYDAAVAFYAPATAQGTWAMEIASFGVVVTGCNGAGVAYSGWPSHVANNLEGSPGSGFRASGTAWRHDFDPDGPTWLRWSLDVSPLGAGTTWSLAIVAYAPDDSVSHAWWNGTADVRGLHG